jgi:hypothetical protein
MDVLNVYIYGVSPIDTPVIVCKKTILVTLGVVAK